MEGMGKQMKSCVIVGSAPFSDATVLREYITQDSLVIAADGGQRLLDAMGISCDLIVGDFDSSDTPTCGDVPIVTLPTHKDDTDALAAVRIALERGCDRFVLLGCLGGRLDHTLANVFLLRFLHDHGAQGLLADETQEVHLLGVGTHEIPPHISPVFSVFPYGGDASGVSIREAKYTVDNTTLDTALPLGVSNEFIDKPAVITIENGFLLLVFTKKP